MQKVQFGKKMAESTICEKIAESTIGKNFRILAIVQSMKINAIFAFKSMIQCVFSNSIHLRSPSSCSWNL